MHEEFKIFVDRLRNGHKEKIEEKFSPQALEMKEEKELFFPSTVDVSGETYLAEDHLVLHIHISTQVTVPCTICNEKFTIPIEIPNVYISTPLSEIRDSTFDYSSEVREAVLLQIPTYFECQDGNCPERTVIKKYLKPSPSSKKSSSPAENEGVNFPFADL